MSKQIKESILRDCYGERDYSDAFFKKVEKLKERAEKEFSTPIEHGTDMNYGASNQLYFYLNKFGEFISHADQLPFNEQQKKTPYKIEILISSLGDYYWLRSLGTKYLFGFIKLNTWSNEPKFTYKTFPAVEKLRAFFEDAGYISIPDDILSSNVPGKKTELYNDQATVFDVIFSEI